MMKLRPEVAFLAFALLLSSRDICADFLLLNDAPEVRHCLAFTICITITMLSLALLFKEGGSQALVRLARKMRPFGVLTRVVGLGIAAAAVYLITFEMIGREMIGAGLFNLFDYGLAPVITMLIGVVALGDPFRVRVLVSLPIYLFGLVLLFWDKGQSGYAWLALAALSPIGTASSDGITKWLLSGNGGNFSRAELLFVRFAPASALIAWWIMLRGDQIHMHYPVRFIPLAVIGGFLPLWLLCTGLGHGALSKLAVWECLIPAIVFVGTLFLRSTNFTTWTVLGATLVVMSVALNEISLSRRRGESHHETSPETEKMQNYPPLSTKTAATKAQLS